MDRGLAAGAVARRRGEAIRLAASGMVCTTPASFLLSGPKLYGEVRLTAPRVDVKI